MALPDFFIAGAPKAGTTALHAALARHQALYMSAVKEPKFFLTDGPPSARGGPGDVQTYREHVWRREDYEALFDPAPAGVLRGESTPFYLYNWAAQRRIRALIPDAKIIVILRDPVERAHSNWTHLWSAGLDPVGDVVRACAEEDRRIEAGWADFWHYTALGRYGEQLEHLYTVFPREQVMVFRYRALVGSGRRAGPHLRIPRRADGRAHRGAAGERHRAPAPDPAPSRAVPGAAGRRHGQRDPARPDAGDDDQPAERRLQQDAPPRRPLTWEQRQALIPRFETDIRLLEYITGEDFGDWLQPRGDSGGLVGSRPSGQRQARNGQPRAF